MKMIPDENLELWKGMKSIKDGNSLGKYNNFFLIILVSVKDNWPKQT